MKTYTKLAVAFLAVALFAFTPSLAQVEKGDNEVSVNASITSSETDAPGDKGQSAYTLNGAYGRFFTDAQQVKMSVYWNSTDDKNTGTDMTSYWLTAGWYYHFNTSNKTVPYAGIGLLYYGFDAGAGTSESGVGGNIDLGVKHFLSDKTALNAFYQYFQVDFGTPSVTYSQHGLFFGFSVFF
jgi:outer membrane protein W